MTREEAIEVMKDIYNYTRFDTYTTNEARTMAIKALEQEPCDDAVSRQEAIHCVTETELYNETFAEAKMRIAELKPVLPKREQGEWICDDFIESIYHCSLCQGKIKGKLSKYCPNCGAKMR